MRFTVQGAYGRHYANKKAMKADYDAGKDFKIMLTFPPTQSGLYMSNRDVKEDDEIIGYFGDGLYLNLNDVLEDGA